MTEGWTCEATMQADGWYRCQKNEMKVQLDLGYFRSILQTLDDKGQ